MTELLGFHMQPGMWVLQINYNSFSLMGQKLKSTIRFMGLTGSVLKSINTPPTYLARNDCANTKMNTKSIIRRETNPQTNRKQ